METIDIFNVTRGNDQFHLFMRLTNDELRIEGHDFSRLAESMFGGDEYEYFYDFDKENTVKLKEALGETDVIRGVLNFFKGEMIVNEFVAFCKSHDIKYSYFSWHE